MTQQNNQPQRWNVLLLALLSVLAATPLLQCSSDEDASPEASPADIGPSSVNVMTWNLACRDFAPFSGCENCDARLGLISDAVRGEPGFEGSPDFESLDIILAQELFTEAETIEPLSSALRQRGFVEAVGPLPGPESEQCEHPAYNSDLPRMGDNGGLVTWSKHPILAFTSRLWCVHGFPTYQGYTAALIDVNGSYVVAFNMHMMPEYDFLGLKAEDIRTYQFSEIANQARTIVDEMLPTGAPFQIVIGGDFNEDAYHLNHTKQETDCSAMNDREMLRNFKALNYDVVDECEHHRMGVPTWSPSRNALAGRFSDSGKHETLDYLIQEYSTGDDQQAEQVVHEFKYTAGWQGEFCDDPSKGTLGGVEDGTTDALSDHQAVTASFALAAAGSPASNADGAWVGDAFLRGMARLDLNEGACGQDNTQCVFDTNCCLYPEYSFDHHAYECGGNGLCNACKGRGEACNWEPKGSECCNYYSNSGNALYCETSGLTQFKGVCASKRQSGEFCIMGSQCLSGECVGSWLAPPTWACA